MPIRTPPILPFVFEVSEPMNDDLSTLMDRLRKGDALAAEELVAAYEPEIRRFIRIRLSSPRMRISERSLNFVTLFKDTSNLRKILGREVRSLCRIVFAASLPITELRFLKM